MPLKATIIFEGDSSVGQRDEVYSLELPYTQQEWDGISEQKRNRIGRKLFDLYNWLHQEQTCKVYLPGEKY